MRVMLKTASKNILSVRLMVGVSATEGGCFFFFFHPNLLTVVSILQKVLVHITFLFYMKQVDSTYCISVYFTPQYKALM